LTCQMTAVFALSPTEAVKATGLPPAEATGPLGVTETTVIGARQVIVALAGAEVLALVELMVAVAVLLRPPLSVTVSVTVTVPLLGAVTVVVPPLGLLTGFVPELLDH